MQPKYGRIQNENGVRRCFDHVSCRQKGKFKMMEEVVFSKKPRSLVASIKCELDHHAARRIREQIDEELYRERPEVLVLDFSAVSFMDSSGLGLILGRCERADCLGASVKLVGLSDTLYKLIRLCGIERVKNLSVGIGC